MELEAASEQNKESQPAISLPFPEATWGRVVYGLYITIVPALAFWSVSVLGPEWQSGKISDYITLFLFPEASWIFFVLLAYSVICYLLLLIAPARCSRSFLIRLGIYTGTLLALQYSLLAVPVLFNSGFKSAFLVVWIFPLVFQVIHRWAVTRWTAATVNNLLFTLVVVVLAAGIWVAGGFVFVLAALAMSGPFWSLLIASQATLWLFKNYETRFSRQRGAGLAGWLAVYAAAWRFDILKMYELYAALPKQPPPDCYIATAAACGHPQFVQAWTVRCAGGEAMRVNPQLQRLKCAELALLAVSPRLHRPFRQAYDGIGKRLADRIRDPFRADVAYLLLKPGEWLARLLLKIIIPEIDSVSKKMYMSG